MRKDRAIRGTPFIRAGIDTGFAAALSMRPVPHGDYRMGSALPVLVWPETGHNPLAALWRRLRGALVQPAKAAAAERDRRWMRNADAEADLRRLHDVGILRSERYGDVLRRL